MPRGTVTLRDPIAADKVRPGTEVIGNHGGQQHRGCVTDDGQIRLRSRRVTGTPSATAAKMTGFESNGWLFWKVPAQTERGR